MALGAIQAMKAAGIKVGGDGGVVVVGIDGEREAVESILAGEMAATITCSPLYGPIAFDTLEKLIAGETLPEKIQNVDRIIDATNAQQELPNAF